MNNSCWIILSLCLLTVGVFIIGIYIAPSARAMGMINHIQREKGFIPYVASVGLDKVTEVPREKKGIFQ